MEHSFQILMHRYQSFYKPERSPALFAFRKVLLPSYSTVLQLPCRKILLFSPDIKVLGLQWMPLVPVPSL